MVQVDGDGDGDGTRDVNDNSDGRGELRSVVWKGWIGMKGWSWFVGEKFGGATGGVKRLQCSRGLTDWDLASSGQDGVRWEIWMTRSGC